MEVPCARRVVCEGGDVTDVGCECGVTDVGCDGGLLMWAVSVELLTLAVMWGY